MKNLTQLIKDKTIELTELKSTIDGMGWFIERGDEASLRDVKHQCSLIVDKLNKRYFVQYVDGDNVFDVIKFHQDSYNTIGIDLSYDYGYKSRGRVQLFRWNQYGGLELSFTRNQSTPSEVVDIVYDVYSNDIQKDILDIIKNHIEPTRKLKKDLDNKKNKYGDLKLEVVKELKQDVEVMIENGDVITFDKPTHIDQLEADIKSIQFVREPNRKLGVVKIEYQGLLGSIITNDNWFEKKKQSISVVDILHTHFYKTLGL